MAQFTVLQQRASVLKAPFTNAAVQCETAAFAKSSQRCFQPVGVLWVAIEGKRWLPSKTSAEVDEDEAAARCG